MIRLTILSLFMLIAPMLNAIEPASSGTQQVTVQIDFGDVKPTQTIMVDWCEGFTAMRALQHAATIESYPLGKYVFVTSINGVKGKRGVKAWYYTLNNQSPGKLAISNNINPGDTVRWIYKDDVCSKTVDNK